MTETGPLVELFASASADKRAWWAELKAKIGTNLLPQRVASRTSVISPEGIRSAGQGTKNESAPAATKRKKSRAEFYVGQRVRMTLLGKSVFKRTRSTAGVVVRIEDLSFVYPVDDPNGKRNFSLDVRLDGNKGGQTGGNAAYWEPEPQQ